MGVLTMMRQKKCCGGVGCLHISKGGIALSKKQENPNWQLKKGNHEGK
jgi:hypothetical protein